MIRSLLAVAALVGASSVFAQSIPASVSGTANIFGAGLAAPLPSASASCGAATQGIAPVQINVPAGVTAFTVNTVTGSVFCAAANFTSAADGPCVGGLSTAIPSENNLSGISAANRNMFLTGVFLGAGAPVGPAPAALDFTTPTFTSLAPALQQVFYIGDGLTGSGTGTVQQFVVPAGATRLFLGYADAFAFQGPSGCYSDNSGSVSLNVVFGAFQFPTIPTQGGIGLGMIALLLAIAGLSALYGRRGGGAA